MKVAAVWYAFCCRKLPSVPLNCHPFMAGLLFSASTTVVQVGIPLSEPCPYASVVQSLPSILAWLQLTRIYKGYWKNRPSQ